MAKRKISGVIDSLEQGGARGRKAVEVTKQKTKVDLMKAERRIRAELKRRGV